MKNQIELRYGCLCDELETQLNEQGFTLGENAEKYENLKNSLNMVVIHGLLTDTQSQSAFGKLHKKTMKDIKVFKRNEK